MNNNKFVKTRKEPIFHCKGLYKHTYKFVCVCLVILANDKCTYIFESVSVSVRAFPSIPIHISFWVLDF